MAEYKTPGVYIQELDAFPNTIVAVETAIPVFIGYTQMAVNNKRSLVNKPTKITTMAEYHMYFGRGPTPVYTFSVEANGAFGFAQDSGRFFLYNGLRAYFANGGGPCYIVSVGSYSDSVSKESLIGGLQPLLKEQEPTMVVLPDAQALDAEDCYTVYNEALMHCEKMQSRVAIMDVTGGDQPRSGPGITTDVVEDFRNGVQQSLNYGAAYYPWLNTNIVGDNEINYTNLTDDSVTTTLVQLLENEADDLFGADSSPKKNQFLNKVAELEKKPSVVAATGAAQTAFGSEPAVLAQQTLATTAVTNATAAYNAALTDLSTTIKALGGDQVSVDISDPDKEKKTLSDLDAAATAVIQAKAQAVTDAGPDDPDNRAEVQKAMDDLSEAERQIGQKQQVVQSTRAARDGAVAEKARIDATLTGLQSTVTTNIGAITSGKVGQSDVNTLHLSLMAVSPTYRMVMEELKKEVNVMPAASFLAGVYARVDNSEGVFKAPANTGLVSVVSPTVNLTHDEQEDLNVPLDGKAINAIRAFPGRGVLVWGARTLDGNSQDWRYVNVRRTIIMLEQSIKVALGAYVFEPNTASTWSTVDSMITNFLTNQWKAGALAGATPPEAFEVFVGLGSTMTSNDILDGYMRITVKVAIVRPAEFIVLTFQQKMQTS